MDAFVHLYVKLAPCRKLIWVPTDHIDYSAFSEAFLLSAVSDDVAPLNILAREQACRRST